ncbi:putative ribonuclease H-like domain-containing protein [Tanacetum coccineum]
MEFENRQNNALAKLPMLKLKEYEMWEIRIKQYFQIQDYALWDVIENENSWVPIPVTTPPEETGTSTTTKMTSPATIEEKTCKKNDVKARSLLLMALPNEHQLTFDQYVDAQSMFAAIKARFGNEATKKTQKALLKQQLTILGVVTPPEDLNVKFLRSLPSEWDTHVVVWMNKPDFDTMGLDDLYNNFKIVEQKVKKSAGASNDDKNLAFVTTSGASSTNNINTVNPEVSTATTKVNTASTEIYTASFSDATIYAFLSTQPKGSQLVHEDLEQLHDDDLEEMDLKWNMALLSMRARKFYQRTGRKIIIDGSNTAGYDKSKVECFNCHKLGHFARECRAPRSKDNRNWNQGSSTKAVKIEDASEKAMCAIDGAGFDWSDMAEEEIQANMALMAFSDSEVNKSSTYKRGLETLEDQIVKYREHEVRFSEEIALLKRSVGSKEYQLGLLRTELEKVKQEKEGFDFKIAKFDKSAKDLNEMLESQITDKSKKGVGYNVVPSPHPLILNRPTPLDLSYSGLEEFKEPEVNEYGPRDSSLKPITSCDKESDNSKENTNDSLEQHQMTDTETSSFESPLKVDKDWKEKFFYPANHVESVNKIEKPVRKNNDAPIIEDWVSDDEDEVETTVVVKKKTVIPTAAKIEKPVRKPVRYAEMYRSQRPRGNQRNWNGQKSNQLGCNFVFNNKACFICESFDHIQYSCPNQQRKRIVSGNNYNKKDNDYYSKTSHPSAHKHMAPRAVLMKTGLKSFNTARPVNTVRSVNTGRPFSTARSFNTVRPFYTAHPKSTIHCARPRTYFQNQAQSTVHRPFYKRTTLTKRCFNQRFNTGRPFRSTVNTVRARGFNAVKPSACWVWRPIKPNGASLSNSQLNDKGFVDSGCSRHMTRNIAHLSDFKDFDGGYVTFGGGAYGGRITGKDTIKTDNLDFDDVYFFKELKFNLFRVSQMCDKKNYVLFTDSECLFLSPNFKLPDENQILFKIPRHDNMYSFDMKNIVPKDGLTCLVAKATSEESMLWHRRLGHINFKNINKLVKENLVRDLPLKRFENDQTCVACLKGKQHRASCKTKAFNPITKPLFMLHMDLFGPTFVSSLMHKKYCLVVTDDYSRFSWVFFLTTKDETSEILKIFIKEVENLVDKKVKIIRSDNGTEFKNKVMDDFCKEKGIKREYSVARTPQQNGVAERKNRTLIEAARTMLADSKLPTTFWAEAVSTACYVQNRVLIVKPHNKTPYELFRGFKPAIGFMKPFGCHVTILNTLDNLGKFDGKSDEGFFVGYSLSSKSCLGIQGVSESSTSSQQDQDNQDCIIMPIWKDASYFGDAAPRSVADAQIQDKDRLHDENDASEKSPDDSSLKDNGTVVQQVNTARPEIKLVHLFKQERKNDNFLSEQGFLSKQAGGTLHFQTAKFWILVELPKGHKQWINRKRKAFLIIQLNMVNEIFEESINYTDVKSASTPTDLEKPLVQDGDAADVDEHLYRSMITGKKESLMRNLTAPGQDIMLQFVHVQEHQELTSPEQTATGKDFSNPLIVDSLLKTTWSSMHHVFTMKHWLDQSKRLLRSAEATTDDNGEVKIIATIDGHLTTITEASLRRRLKLDDHDGITSIPNSEIFEQLALMGYHTDSDKLTFQKGAFSPQWRFLIHTILHCLSPKKTAWEQFSSNIATAVICLATNRTFNFSRLIFEHMVSNISSPHKFLMYPRFIQICLDMQRKQLQQHSRTYHVPSLSIKVFNNIKRPTKGYSGQEVALFHTMLNVSEPSTSPSRTTSSPSPSPEPYFRHLKPFHFPLPEPTLPTHLEL